MPARRRSRTRRLLLAALLLLAAWKGFTAVSSTVALERRLAAGAAALVDGSVEIGLADTDFWRTLRVYRAAVSRGGVTVARLAKARVTAERPYLLGDPGGLDLEVDGLSLNLAALLPLAVEASARSGFLDPSALGRPLRLRGAGAELTVSLPSAGRLDLGGITFEAAGTLRSAEVSCRGGTLGGRPAAFSATARLAEGGLEAGAILDPHAILPETPLAAGPFSFSGTLSAILAARAPLPFAAASLEAGLELRFLGATLAVTLGGRHYRLLDATGGFVCRPGEPPRLIAAGALEPFRGASLSLDAVFARDFSSLTAEGRLESGLLRAAADGGSIPFRIVAAKSAAGAVLDASLGAAGSDRFHASVSARADTEGVSVERLEMTAGGQSFRVSGALPRRAGMTLRVKAEGVDLGKLRPPPLPFPWPEAGRLVTCDLVLASAPPAGSGAPLIPGEPWSDLGFVATIPAGSIVPEGKFELESIERGGFRIDSVAAGFRLDGERVELADARIRAGGIGAVRLSGSLRPGNPFRAEVAVRDCTLEPGALERAGLSGSVKLKVEGRLAVEGEAFTFEGGVAGAKARFRGLPFPPSLPLTARGRLSAGIPRFEALRFGPAGGLDLTLGPAGEGYRLEGALPGFDPAALLPASSLVRVKAVEDARLEASFDRSFGLREASLACGAIAAEIGGVPLSAASAVFRYAGGRLSARGLQVTLAGASATLSFTLDPGSGRTDISLAGRGIDPAPLLARFAPGVRAADARLDLDVEMNGLGASPGMRGSATLTAGRFDLPGLGEPLRDLRLSLAGEGAGLAVREGSFRSGGSLWAVRGSVRSEGGAVPILDLSVENASASVDVRDLVNARGSARLTIKGPLVAPAVSGEVRVDEGVLHLPGDIDKARDVDLGGVTLDLVLRAERRFWVRNAYLNAELKGEVRVASRGGRPVLRGELTAVRGTFSFNGREFRIEDGAIRFPDSRSLAPILEVRAEARVAQYTVRVETAGMIDALAVNLTSSPNLTRDEILALLATGDPKQSFTGGDTARAGGALVVNYQKNQVLGGIKRSIQDSLKLDDLSFDAGGEGERGGRKSNLRVGKYMSDKVYVQYSLERSDEQRKQERMEFDVKMDKRLDLNLKNESDRGTSFGIKVKNRF